ncbi:uncharacterized protein LOC135487267 [Lineus longissimus]|uniref:uncharacterized protein LOC135487267 n=1 Tax=Lineus longissimus TaxID=88925 RepID=UPI00315DE61A
MARMKKGNDAKFVWINQTTSCPSSPVNESARWDCQVNREAQCLQHDCCYSASGTPGVPWCYAQPSAIDEEASTTFHWAPNEPSKLPSQVKRTCAILWDRHDFMWDDQECDTNNHGYICQFDMELINVTTTSPSTPVTSGRPSTSSPSTPVTSGRPSTSSPSTPGTSGRPSTSSPSTPASWTSVSSRGPSTSGPYKTTAAPTNTAEAPTGQQGFVLATGSVVAIVVVIIVLLFLAVLVVVYWRNCRRTGVDGRSKTNDRVGFRSSGGFSDQEGLDNITIDNDLYFTGEELPGKIHAPMTGAAVEANRHVASPGGNSKRETPAKRGGTLRVGDIGTPDNSYDEIHTNEKPKDDALRGSRSIAIKAAVIQHGTIVDEVHGAGFEPQSEDIYTEVGGYVEDDAGFDDILRDAASNSAMDLTDASADGNAYDVPSGRANNPVAFNDGYQDMAAASSQTHENAVYDVMHS